MSAETTTLDQLRITAEQGDAKAQRNLAFCYAKGNGVPQDIAQAVVWFQKAAEQGDAHAQYNLGHCYAKGNGVPKNLHLALKWYHRAIESKDVKFSTMATTACDKISQQIADEEESKFKENLKTWKTIPRKHRWQSLVTLRVVIIASICLVVLVGIFIGTRWRNGGNVNKEIHVEKLLENAQQGDAEAQYNLGKAYSDGVGVLQNDTQAFTWFKKSADNGNAKGQNALGWCYDFARGVPQDFGQALSLYQKSATQGWKRAQYSLGVCYHFGRGVLQDDEKAVYWFSLAAKQGYYLAQYALGGIYKTDGDYIESAKWYQKAAEQGYYLAQYALGGICEKDGNFIDSAKWYQKAAEQGHADSQNCLGIYYENGTGVPQNDTQAIYWYRKAADQENAFAEFNLGCFYDKGSGDFDLATLWFQKAADHGNTTAQFRLGNCYEKGKGVSRDFVIAYMWYSLAENSNFAARMARNKIEDKMTSDDFSKAQKLIKKWKPKLAEAKN